MSLTDPITNLTTKDEFSNDKMKTLQEIQNCLDLEKEINQKKKEKRRLEIRERFKELPEALDVEKLHENWKKTIVNQEDRIQQNLQETFAAKDNSFEIKKQDGKLIQDYSKHLVRHELCFCLILEYLFLLTFPTQVTLIDRLPEIEATQAWFQHLDWNKWNQELEELQTNLLKREAQIASEFRIQN